MDPLVEDLEVVEEPEPVVPEEHPLNHDRRQRREAHLRLRQLRLHEMRAWEQDDFFREQVEQLRQERLALREHVAAEGGGEADAEERLMAEERIVMRRMRELRRRQRRHLRFGTHHAPAEARVNREPAVRPQRPRPKKYHDELEEIKTVVSHADGVEVSLLNMDVTDLFIRRVTACVGWAVHGLIFEFVNGKREGILCTGSGIHDQMRLNDENIKKRSGCKWTDVQYGDYITAIHGRRLRDNILINGNTFLCFSVTLTFASGMEISYEATHDDWKGEPFSRVVPPQCLVYRVPFEVSEDRDICGVKTSAHLLISPHHALNLPLPQKKALKNILLVAQRLDDERNAANEKSLGADLWWFILSFLPPAWALLSPPKKSGME